MRQSISLGVINLPLFSQQLKEAKVIAWCNSKVYTEIYAQLWKYKGNPCHVDSSNKSPINHGARISSTYFLRKVLVILPMTPVLLEVDPL